MKAADLPDNGEVVTPAKRKAKHKDAGRGVEIGLDTDTGMGHLVVPTACDWFIADRGLLAIKNEKGDEVAHVASGQWLYVAHPGVVTVL